VKDNTGYPYLAGGQTGSVTYMGGNDANTTSNGPSSGGTWTSNTGVLPASNAKHLQAKIPQYTVIDVSGNTVTFNTYNVNGTTSIDTFTVTK
jgi:hypothetical protein